MKIFKLSLEPPEFKKGEEKEVEKERKRKRKGWKRESKKQSQGHAVINAINQLQLSSFQGFTNPDQGPYFGIFKYLLYFSSNFFLSFLC